MEAARPVICGIGRANSETIPKLTLTMMNGRAVRSMLIRNYRADNGSVEHMPRPIQFDESSEEYRCLCNCFHVKIGAYLIGAVHARGVKENYVFASFLVEMIGLAVGSLALEKEYYNVTALGYLRVPSFPHLDQFYN
ncbi:hypothetical protein NECAME_17896 [Necator americanus]|uniref:Uncharacterized protein n=1 Tax=Necator americanus TaxID=51031 RepID=W2TIU8_NECAM|nr:hypothetical protein NECAME_17896 [Necator americanus]ETN81514.1 hypothetical protein NECAME_17896 [Necator americanus]